MIKESDRQTVTIHTAGVKPCPFCGSEDRIGMNITRTVSGKTATHVGCDSCGCSSAIFLHMDAKLAIQTAKDAWNNRAKPKKDK